MNELRWNPLRCEWVVISSKRKKRYTSGNPFSKNSEEMKGRSTPTIVPNKYPNFIRESFTFENDSFYQKSEAYGTADILVETDSETGDFDDYSINNITQIILAAKDRCQDLSADSKIKYVHIFKNKGSEAGSSITHPHMQIYGMPFTPPVIAEEIKNSENHYEKHGTNIFDEIIKSEQRDSERIIHQDDFFTSFVPFFGRWPYECHVVPHRSIQSILDLNEEEVYSLSKQIKIVVKCYNSLFSHKMSYVLLFHQVPFGKKFENYRFYLEFQPSYQADSRLKYAAGIERLGTFEVGYLTPEKAASNLRSNL